MNHKPQSIAVGSEPPPLSGALDGEHAQRRRKDKPAAKRNPPRRKTADRFAAINAFVDFTLAGLTRNEIAVWLVLYRDTRNGVARTSQADMARRVGVAARTVRRALDGLKRRGLLEVTYRGGIGRGASAYRVRPFPPDGGGQGSVRL